VNLPLRAPCLTVPTIRRPRSLPSKTTGGTPGTVNRTRPFRTLAGTVWRPAWPGPRATRARLRVRVTEIESSVGSVYVPVHEPVGEAAGPAPIPRRASASAMITTSLDIVRRRRI
jgi:hypothetical protein